MEGEISVSTGMEIWYCFHRCNASQGAYPQHVGEVLRVERFVSVLMQVEECSEYCGLNKTNETAQENLLKRNLLLVGEEWPAPYTAYQVL